MAVELYFIHAFRCVKDIDARVGPFKHECVNFTSETREMFAREDQGGQILPPPPSRVRISKPGAICKRARVNGENAIGNGYLQ